MSIKNLKELEQRGTLEEGDHIVFAVDCGSGDITDLEYIVEQSCFGIFLNISTLLDNSIIFETLNLETREFCFKAYGYKTDGGVFPYTKKNDFKAITRVVREIYKVLYNIKEEIIEEDSEEVDRFSLIDFD